MSQNPIPPTQKFLQYPDGDVIISLSDTVEFILHSETLSKHSDFFRIGLSSTWVGNKVCGTKTVAGRTVTMKRYELDIDTRKEEHFLEAKPMPTPAAERHIPTIYTEKIEAAYQLGFELMYEDVEGPPVHSSCKNMCYMAHVDEFMDAYQCYTSKTMCWRLEALISSCDEERMVDRDPFHYLRIAQQLHMPRIWISALKAAALQHYQRVERPDHVRDGISGWTDQDSGPEQKMLKACGPEILEVVRSLSKKIATHYEPVRITLTTIKFDSILWEKEGLRSYLNNDRNTSIARNVFERWQKYPFAQDSLFKLLDDHIFWKVFTGQYEAGDMVDPLCRASMKSGYRIYDILKAVVEKLRECVAPLYEELWKGSNCLHAPRYSVPYWIDMDFDPVPCIRGELEREFKSQRALRAPRLRGSEG